VLISAHTGSSKAHQTITTSASLLWHILYPRRNRSTIWSEVKLDISLQRPMGA